MSKGNLLLMQESTGQQQLLSLQAATSLLVSVYTFGLHAANQLFTPHSCAVLLVICVIDQWLVIEMMCKYGLSAVQVSAGISMERYQVYCRLMRAGYIVTRCRHLFICSICNYMNMYAARILCSSAT